jgi:hypothetical protein
MGYDREKVPDMGDEMVTCPYTGREAERCVLDDTIGPHHMNWHAVNVLLPQLAEARAEIARLAGGPAPGTVRLVIDLVPALRPDASPDMPVRLWAMTKDDAAQYPGGRGPDGLTLESFSFNIPVKVIAELDGGQAAGS